MDLMMPTPEIVLSEYYSPTLKKALYMHIMPNLTTDQWVGDPISRYAIAHGVQLLSEAYLEALVKNTSYFRILTDRNVTAMRDDYPNKSFNLTQGGDDFFLHDRIEKEALKAIVLEGFAEGIKMRAEEDKDNPSYSDHDLRLEKSAAHYMIKNLIEKGYMHRKDSKTLLYKNALILGQFSDAVGGLENTLNLIDDTEQIYVAKTNEMLRWMNEKYIKPESKLF